MKRMHRKKISLAVMNALGAGMVVSLAAPVASAQDATPAPSSSQTTTSPSPVILAQAAGAPAATTTAAAPPKIERVEVTGSRLPSLTLESVSPVNVISAQDIKWDGITNTANIINQLPSAFADQGNNLSNGATGTSAINLRNLGASRTLVLIDGRRLPAGSPQFWPTDVNVIPARADRARRSPDRRRVGGLRLRCHRGRRELHHERPFRGRSGAVERQRFQPPPTGHATEPHRSQRDQSGSFPIPGNVGLDGDTQNFSMLLGGNFANGKGNATLFFNYRQAEASLQGTRNFSACALSSNATGLTSAAAARRRTRPATSTAAQTQSAPYTVANAAGDVRPLTTADRLQFCPVQLFPASGNAVQLQRICPL